MNFSYFKLLFLLLSLSTFKAYGAVWNDTQAWSLQYEEEFSRWMQSSNVNEAMFTDARSPYYGINTDCADTAYAFRAIFAYEKKLPFALYNPSGSRTSNKTLNNRLSNWDNQGSELQRLRAMINEIGETVGTENLANFDTFPTAIKSVAPGTLFMYKIKARFRKFIRHAYNIKDISPIGTFDVIYSTQANKAKKLPLIRRKDREFDVLPTAPWGFKKFRWPEHIGADLSKIPSELGPSNEQFALSQSLGMEFFSYVKKSLSSVNESTAQRLNRSFQAVCQESVARIDYVKQGLDRLLETNNSCMNYEEFDAYSTPARDQSLKELFERYKMAYEAALKDGSISSLPLNLTEFSEIIFKNKGNTNTRSELLKACPINYRPNISIDLATLWSRISQGLLSSHPNDSVALRWGEAKSPETRCKRWY